jgi:hypothetical protein
MWTQTIHIAQVYNIFVVCYLQPLFQEHSKGREKRPYPSSILFKNHNI